MLQIISFVSFIVPPYRDYDKNRMTQKNILIHCIFGPSKVINKKRILPYSENIMSITRSFLLLLSLSSFCLFGQIDYQPRRLLVILDNTEATKWRMGSISLLAALSEKTCPIITTTSLLANLFKDYQPGSLTGISKDEIVQKLAIFDRIDSSTKNIVLDVLAFDKNQWIIKKCGDGLCLLIPHIYLQSIGLSAKDAQTPSNSPQPTELELTLGLKVQHLPSFDISDAVLGENYSFINAAYDEENKKSLLFCIRSDYKNKKEIPFWTWYILGHGATRSIIAGMPLSDFKKLLDFMAEKLSLNLLTYTSCYAAGVNEQLIYRDAVKGVQKIYPFTIISEAITDVPVAVRVTILFTAQGNTQQLKFSINFSDFFEETSRAGKPIDFLAAIKHIFSDFANMPNIPQIKLPGTEWFSVLHVNDSTISLGKNFTLSRDPNKPLDIISYYKKQPKTLLLYSNIIPFPLVINSNTLQAIIPMDPSELYILEEIRSSQQVNTCIGWFLAPKLNVDKTYYIKTLNDIQDVFIVHEQIASIEEEQFQRYALYTENGDLREINSPFSPEETAKKYQALLEKARGKVTNFGKFTFFTTYSIRFPKFTTGVIESIETPALTIIVFIGDILQKLNDAKTSNATLWINSLQGAYSTRLNIPELENKRGTKITLQNVVLDGPVDIYYTYNNQFYKNSSKTSDYTEQIRKKLAPQTEQHKHHMRGFDFTKRLRSPDLLDELYDFDRKMNTLQSISSLL